MTFDESSIVDPVGKLADEFVARYRRGERPALSEYVDKHPELAERIKHVFPMLVMMEQAGSGKQGSTSDTCSHAGANTDRVAPLPEQFGGYRILREIGRGGMGVVYEAEQIALGRHVALKVLPLHAARDGSGLARFRCEAKAAARLHHTNIVPVHEVGEDGELCYYAMQLIHGQPLDEVITELKRLRSSGEGIRLAEAPSDSIAQSLVRGEHESSNKKLRSSAVAVSLPGQSEANSRTSSVCPITAASPESVCKSRKRWNTPTKKALSTVTSSLLTCSWMAAALSCRAAFLPGPSQRFTVC